ncbi:tRNA (adenosine(37)-N6)-threonylcarbamoyltransferase complex transferase subunit TsaD [Candidatus Curtissbacteria bacterium RIFCSPLOWO2_01_FULL_41_18]|uniref:tRNA N6-adenosine threonylcarbamoyltransferase n=1 Tax=Candidatus Curtissbacteria bacterium RIFCSPLOWO2_01_FULL_41_18 TaxID=1797727 RepID=A0A1F5HL11_9BACT|nr:MAG: tRNA (adenosine(37)-N6)-threonylcarbamoyltransferase complex transferase subunit TsaD [Candidatus Curtissbacteria bacterium RIFCSPLOWO2_01_FULL_41_18]
MKILGIETTCDETGAAVVEGKLNSTLGLKLLSNVVASSVELQKKYGGVVPEVAAREQVRVIIPVIKEALSEFSPKDIDAIAVAHGPGLIGSLLIGVETAKVLALAWNKPLIGINHLVGHIYANSVCEKSKIKNQKSKIEFPLIALVVSGGHTDLVLMAEHGKFRLIGSTLDDAAGEAFDKVAKLLGLGYPGGPEIEKLASSVPTKGEARQRRQRLGFSVNLPRPMIGSKNFNFSFSGLKTAVVNLVHSSQFTVHRKSEIAAEFQQAVVDVLVTKTINAAKKYRVKSIVVGGGVAANELLRSEFIVHSKRLGIEIIFPSKEFSVDNGAMIAAAAFYNFKKVDPEKLSADPSLHF